MFMLPEPRENPSDAPPERGWLIMPLPRYDIPDPLLVAAGQLAAPALRGTLGILKDRAAREKSLRLAPLGIAPTAKLLTLLPIVSPRLEGMLLGRSILARVGADGLLLTLLDSMPLPVAGTLPLAPIAKLGLPWRTLCAEGVPMTVRALVALLGVETPVPAMVLPRILATGSTRKLR
jgi:hypothetical protein